MNLEETLLALEEEGWQALSAAGGADYYRERFLDRGLMVFPFGVIDKARTLEAIASAPPWATFRIEEPRVVALTTTSAALLYRVTAQRAGGPLYAAFITSVYVEDAEGWKLAVHHQTPVAAT